MKPIMGDESSEMIRRVISEDSSQKMKEILKEVVLSGTAKGSAESSFYSTAGKTASSVLELSKYRKFKGNERPNFAAFIGFSPMNNPQIQVFVGMIKEDLRNNGAHGGEHAAPVFKEVAENVLAFMKVSPDKF